MSNPPPRVLVTGGAGFIGSALARAYLQAGATVAVVDNLSKGHAHRIPTGVTFHRLDVQDPAFETLVERERFDLVNHHAALKDVRRALLDPVSDAEANILGTLRVLHAAARAGVRRVILASSSAVYGEAEQVPTPETAPLCPLSPYGVSKATGEHYAAHFARHSGLDCVAFRYGTVYGPGMLAGAEDGVIVRFILTMLHCERPAIYGDGEQTRDFVFVDDVVRANLLASDMTELAGGTACAGAFRAFNISPSAPVSVNALYAALQRLAGFGAAARHEPAIPGEIHRNHLDNRRARNALGWQARTSLHDGLRAVVEAAKSGEFAAAS